MNWIGQILRQIIQAPLTWQCISLACLIGLYRLQTRRESLTQNRIFLAGPFLFSLFLGLITFVGFSFFYFHFYENLDTTLYFRVIPFVPVFLYTFNFAWSELIVELESRFLPPKYFSFLALGCYEKKRGPTGLEEWVLKPNFEGIQKIVNKLSFVLLVITLLCLGWIFFKQAQTFALWFSFPVIPLFIIHTLSLFLGGPKAQKELKDKVKGKGKQGVASSYYELASRHLQKSFQKALKSYIEAPLFQSYSSPSPEGILSQLEKSNQPQDLLVATYFRHEWTHRPLDPDYVNICAQLINKQNVFVQNPFYQDLGLYLTLPLNQSLMNHHKVLILCHGYEEANQVKEWINTLLNGKSMFPEKWKIQFLQDLEPNCDIGLLKYTNLYDPNILIKNEHFLKDVEYVLLLHPSRFLITTQIPLEVLCDTLRQGGTQPVFCVIDEKRNGLKDTISHVMKTRFDQEINLTRPAPTQRVAIWDANADFQTIERFDKQTRSFGGGIEIGAEAASVQVEKSCWISESRIPLADIQDFAAQSYLSISKVMKELQPSQSILRQKLGYSTSAWQLPKENAQFLIIEDEYNNPFLAANQYVSRANQEVFINILSENYLLRDYFCDNLDVFWHNPNAIPSLVPDFAKTPRNLLFKLILMMRVHPLSEEQLIQEFDLIGLPTNDPKQELFSLIERYSLASPDLFTIEKKTKPTPFGTPISTTWYGIEKDKFEHYFAHILKPVNVILEDERAKSYILDAKVYSLILQTMLPGQFVNYDGKSYQIQRISSTNGVILRRTSDFAPSRKHYAQIRQYYLPTLVESPFVERKLVNGFLFTKLEVDFSVDSLGYLEMENRGNLSSALRHDLTVDPLFSSYSRHYQKKSILTICFPSGSQEDLYQIALLLQELLPTVLPTGYPYLSILAKEPEGFDHQFESVISQAQNLEEQVLVIIEDSDIDLGLLDEFEKHFFDLLAIIQDYIRWTLEQNDQTIKDKEK